MNRKTYVILAALALLVTLLLLANRADPQQEVIIKVKSEKSV